MGAYRSKPLTEKESVAGECRVGSRRIIYGATAMQGWRISMEDAHSIIPHFDEGSSYFGVYDGHGGREVALYCAAHLADYIKSAEAYSRGDLGQAMKDAFMKCDRMLKEKEVIEEMKKYDEDEISEEEKDQDSKEDLENLLEESAMPLQDLLARYGSIPSQDQSEGEDLQRARTGNSILQLLTGSTEIELDSESDEEEDMSSEEFDSSDESEVSEVVSLAVSHSELVVSKTTITAQVEPADGKTEAADNNTEPENSSTDAADCNEPADCSTETTTELAGSKTEQTDEPVDNKTDGKPESAINSKEEDTKPVPSSDSTRVDQPNLRTSPTTKPSPLPPQSNTHDHQLPPAEINTRKPRLDQAGPDELTRRMPTFKPKSLMELLTSKPSADKPMMDFKTVLSSRKRLRHYEDGDGDSEVESKARAAEKQGYHSGTTAVVGVLRENDFIVANAGDSKCVFSSNGKAIDMSLDHKPTDQIELDRITRAGGRVGPDSRVNGGLNLSRALGDHFYKRNMSLPLERQMITAMPDIKSIPINHEQEFIVFACDGIWNSKTSQEVVDFVCCRLKEKAGNGVPTQHDLTLICESLCDACLAPDTDNDGTGCDNMTCILIVSQTLT